MYVFDRLIDEYKAKGGNIYVFEGISDAEACRRIMENYLRGYNNGYAKGKEKVYIYER